MLCDVKSWHREEKQEKATMYENHVLLAQNHVSKLGVLVDYRKENERGRS